MITVISGSADAALANRVRDDLRAAGYTLADHVQRGRESVLVAVLSPQGYADKGVQQAIFDALDNGQHIVPVLARSMPLPDLIDHLTPLDFSSGCDANALRAAVDSALSSEAGYALKVRTPRTKAANRRTAIVVGLMAFGMFLLGLYGVGVLGIQLPQAEYDEVDTREALMRDMIIGPTLELYATYLPRSTEQAAEFPATLDALPTRLAPFVARTATGIHNTLLQFEQTATPLPTSTMTPQ